MIKRKIKNNFSKNEIDIIKNITDIEITDKDYCYDEICNIKFNFDIDVSENNREEKDIIAQKLSSICEEFEEHFNFDNWKHETISSVNNLNTILENYRVTGKTIKDIFLTDNIKLYKDTMVFAYNNDDELSNQPGWTLMKKITQDMIPDRKERTNLADITSPIVIVFDDNSTLELYIKSIGKVFISQNQLHKTYEYNFDLKSAFNSILNQTIDSYIVRSDKNKKDDIWNIKLCLENGIQLAIYPNNCLIMKNENPLGITIGEWKKYVKHYDWLFSLNSEPRYADNNSSEHKWTDLEKALIEALNQTKLSTRIKIPVMLMCNTENKQDKVLKFIMEKQHQGTIEEINESIILEFIANLSEE